MVLRVQVHKTYLRGRKLSTEEQPTEFIEPPCAFTYNCGGCTLQRLPYDHQLAAKEDRLKFELSNIAKISNVDQVLQPVHAAENPFQCDPVHISNNASSSCP